MIARFAKAQRTVAWIAKKPRIVAGGTAVAITAVVIASSLIGSDAPAASIEVGCGETVQTPMLVTSRESAPNLLDPMLRYPVPNVGGTLLPQLYTSLSVWTHPVVDTDRKLPLLPTGHFGAERSGVLRVKCGEGHCGADIDGPRGRPIVAVTRGVVLQIDRLRDGKDGRSGRYVRIEHDDGVLTSYMHLDSIVAALEVGDRVEGGQQIGTLGATGVRTANPHLHFALEIPKRPGMRGSHVSLHYVDPAPFLLRSTVLDEVRPAGKPLW